MATGFLFDSRFLDHQPGRGHPERGERLSGALPHLERQPWFDSLHPVQATAADRRWIETIHSSAYVERARAACLGGAPFLDVTDTGICKDTFDVALLATGGVLNMADRIAKGELANGFVMSRPPGHHAERDLALGFCLFNHVAIAARYLQRTHGLDKVLVLDWDVHHGNGTQHAFEDDPSVLYVSTHQYPYYPGTGAWSETGTGAGAGATLNCPMPAGATDAHYEAAWRELIIPKIDAFRPQIIIVSAGFDAHRDDPLAQINLSTAFFAWMTTRLMELADRHCGGRIVSVLEGGYDVERLGECIAVHLELLCDARAE